MALPRRKALSATVVGLAVVGLAHPAAGQTLEGRVIDEQDDRPVATALVKLVAPDGDERAITVSDSTGWYRLEAPEPGTYRVVAERIGYQRFETPLLAAEDSDAVYPLDLLMRRSPVPILGLEVSAAEADREIRLMIGISPRSLRVQPIRWQTIRSHVERGHDLADMIRWLQTATLVVFETTEGPCIQARSRGCLPVYLNSFRINPEFVRAIPLDMLHTVVVVYPNESITYPAGAVLAYTEAWLR